MSHDTRNDVIAGVRMGPDGAASGGATPDTATAAAATTAGSAKGGRNQRKSVIGRVTSDKMAKTIVVQTNKMVKHPTFKKYVKRRTKYYAHDEKGEAKVGDDVEIMMTRPISKTKNWRLVRVVRKAGA